VEVIIVVIIKTIIKLVKMIITGCGGLDDVVNGKL
jgi:hypothetical protein